MGEAALLWRPGPDRIARAGITRYLGWLEANRGLRFDGYEALWRWSVSKPEAFWQSIRDFSGVRFHSPASAVLTKAKMPGADWFPGATLNYAEHALLAATRPDADRRSAIVAVSELHPRTVISWARLNGEVGAMIETLRSAGVGCGDRCVAYLPNIPQASVAALATIGLGAIWSSTSPEMGAVSVLDRFRQIEPKVLFAVDGYRYGGRDFDRREVVRELVARLPSVETVVFVPYLDSGADLRLAGIRDDSGAAQEVRIIRYQDAIAEPAPPRFTPVPFSHPLWIVYSSGTTGMPKPIVHGHGGTVLEAMKSAALHLDIGPDDRFLWFTSTNWIMWNFCLSALMSGATTVQYDGHPAHPDPGLLWELAERERLSFIGISPAFIGLCMKAGLSPGKRYDLSSLRTVGCTGSPLTADAYRWVYSEVGSDLLLASIAGGTDPNTAFLSACPILPVRAGEMQCRGLGAAVEAWSDEGKPLMGEVGELVCKVPMPSMPLFFWGDADGSRYFGSYFDTFPGPPNVWRHGDWLQLNERPEAVGGVIYGRSDSTINRHGIRMGTSELYRVVEEFDEIADSLVIDLEYLGRDSFLALFVVLREPGSAAAGPGSKGSAPDPAAAVAGQTGVPDALREQILAALRKRLSARHLPNEIYAIPEVPRTLSGKKLEVPVRKILLGQPAERSVNRDSMANPGSIDWFAGFAAARR
jgi:acetoacetyl-CoA synthetase